MRPDQVGLGAVPVIGPTPATSPPEEAPLEPPPPLSQVSSSSIRRIPSAGDPTLVLEGSANYLPGEFLATPPSPQAPEGFLLKVVSSSTSGGTTEVLTEPGSFFEAVPNGEIDADLSESGAVPMNSAAVRLMDASSGISQLFSKHVSCTDGAQAELGGSLQGGLEPRLELKWNKHFGIPTGIDKARVALEAGIEAEVSASVSAKGSCKLGPITLFTPKWEVPVAVGPVVVPVKVEIPVSLIASAEVKGKVSVGAEAGVKGTVGAEYSGGSIHGVHEFSTSHGLTDSVSASAKLRVGLNPEARIKAGWSVPVLGTLGAELDSGITAGPELNYDTTRKPPGSYCAFLDVDSTIALDLPHEDPLKAGPHSWYDGNLGCVAFGPEEGDGKPEVKGETGEGELGELEGKDGEPGFEEARERREEKRLEEEVEQEIKEQEREGKREKEEEERETRERLEEEIGRIERRAPGVGILKWSGEVSFEYLEDYTYSGEYGVEPGNPPTGERYSGHERLIEDGSFEVDGFGTEQHEYLSSTEYGVEAFGFDNSQMEISEMTSFSGSGCNDYYLDQDVSSGHSTEQAEIDAPYESYLGGVYLTMYSPLTFSHTEKINCGVTQYNTTESFPQERYGEIDLGYSGGWPGGSTPGFPPLEGCEVAVKLGSGGHATGAVSSGGAHGIGFEEPYTCNFHANLTVLCRNPDKPESEWVPPDAEFKCPAAKD